MLEATELDKLISEFENPRTRSFLKDVARRLGDEAYRKTLATRDKRALLEEAGRLPREFGPEHLTKPLLSSISSRKDGNSRWYKNAQSKLARTMLLVSIETGFCKDPDLLWFKPRIGRILDEFTNSSLLITSILESPSRCRQHEIIDVISNEARKSKGNRSSLLIATDLESEKTLGLLVEFLKGRNYKDMIHTSRYWKEFSASLDGQTPDDELGYGADTLDKQIKYFGPGTRVSAMVVEFHIWCAERRPAGRPMFSLKDGITMDFLRSLYFVSFYLDGYRAVLWNPADPIPKFDKWYLYPNGTENRSVKAKPGHGQPIDTVLPNAILKNAFKKWLWESANVSIDSLKERSYFIRLALSGLEPMGKESPIVTGRDIQKVVLNLRSRLSPNGLNKAKRLVLEFLSFAEDEGFARMDALCRYLLSRHSKQELPKEIEPAGKKDLEAIRNLLADKSGESLKDGLCYMAFCLECLTPLRINEILDLKVDSVKEIGRKGLYKVESNFKTTGAGKRGLQITPQAKSVIDAAIEITEDVRSQAPEPMRNYVFILPAPRGAFRHLTDSSYSRTLRKACVSLGIPAITASNVRKRQQTDAKLKGIEKGWSKAEVRVLTAHDDPETDDRYYFRPSTREYLLAVHGIEIGTVPLAGTIENEGMEGDESETVEDGCGWCRSPKCNVQGMISCLMCRGFWTTPAHIPDFKRMAAIADSRIANAEFAHDKQRLIAVKRLSLHYLAELMEMQGNRGEER